MNENINYIPEPKKPVKKSFPKFGIIVSVITLLFLIWPVMILIGSSENVSELENEIIVLDKPVVRAENEGKLVLIKGILSTDEEYLYDKDFDIAFHTSLLKRTVYMYQWIEVENGDSEDGYYYNYYKNWSSDVINSNKFKDDFLKKYRNPNKSKPVNDKYWTAYTNLGDFLLPKKFADTLETNVILTGLDPVYGEKYGMTVIDDECYSTVVNGEPKIGDVEIEFTGLDFDLLGTVSMIGMQKGNSVEPYYTKNKEELYRFWTDEMDIETVMAEIEEDAENAAFGMFIFGGVMLLLGIAMCYRGI